jgi:hypothetical protein
MEMDVAQVSKLKRDVAQLAAQVHDLRVVVLRVSAIVAMALIAVGLVLPAWSEVIDDETVTARVLTTAFMTSGEAYGGFDTAARIGFIGLLLVLVLLCGVLVNSVMAGNGRAEGARVRGVIETLAVVGSVVAVLFSFLGAVTDAPNVSGGIGPLVLLVGVIGAVLVMSHRPWQDLWIDQTGRR